MPRSLRNMQFGELGEEAPLSAVPTRSRGRSADKRRKKRTAVPPRRCHSLGELTMPPVSALRVKTQYESLKKRGLQSTSSNGANHIRVEFAFLEVREFPIVLGDNPSCMEGPPITIDWDYDPETQFVLDINTFERMRGDRRGTGQLILPKIVRERKLLKCGVPKADMIKVIRQVRKDKHHRMVSSQQTSLDPMHEAMEKASLGLKKIFIFKKSSYEKTLEAACTSNPPSNNKNISHALSA